MGLGTLYRTIMLENVSVDVVDGARVKGVLGCPSVPGGREGVNTQPAYLGVGHAFWTLPPKQTWATLLVQICWLTPSTW